VLAGYVLGSIPSGYIGGKIGGIDIRKFGSGNIGATNVTRALGKKFGYPVFLADFSKGLAAVLIAPSLGHHYGASGSDDVLRIVGAVSVVLGNAFPVWLRFRGGKGVATSAGMLFGLIPAAAVTVIVVWIIIFFCTRYVSLASILAACALPVTVWAINRISGADRPLVLYTCAVLSTIVILRHRSNLIRLARGTEESFKRREN
jgi:glycerol-3-phosphate acyltransferase PlsY